jgi:hypothetical protein
MTISKVETNELLTKLRVGTIPKLQALAVLKDFERMGLFEPRLFQDGKAHWFVTKKGKKFLRKFDAAETAMSEFEDAVTQLEAVRIAPDHEHAPQGFSVEEMEALVDKARQEVIREILALAHSAGLPAVSVP